MFTLVVKAMTWYSILCVNYKLRLLHIRLLWQKILHPFGSKTLLHSTFLSYRLVITTSSSQTSAWSTLTISEDLFSYGHLLHTSECHRIVPRVPRPSFHVLVIEIHPALRNRGLVYENTLPPPYKLLAVILLTLVGTDQSLCSSSFCGYTHSVQLWLAAILSFCS